MSDRNNKLNDLKNKLKQSIHDYELLNALKDQFEDVLKESTLANWRSRDGIPSSAIDGAILGRELPPDGLENVPRELVKTRLGDIQIRGLWAEAVWHVLYLDVLPDRDDEMRADVWRLWKNIDTIPASMLPKSREVLGESWLVHVSKGEADIKFQNWSVLPGNDRAKVTQNEKRASHAVRKKRATSRGESFTRKRRRHKIHCGQKGARRDLVRLSVHGDESFQEKVRGRLAF